jgi:leucyl aminopeptidase
MTTISLSADSPLRTKADALVVALRPTRGGVETVAPLGRTGKAIADAAGALKATGKAEEVVQLPSGAGVTAPVVVCVGVGAEYDDDALRRAAAAAARALSGRKRAVFALGAESADSVGAIATGAILGAYTFRAYRSSTSRAHKAGLGAVTIWTPLAKDAAARHALAEARVIAEAVLAARDFVNTPPNDLPPAVFAESAAAAAADAGVTAEITDDKALTKGGYGGILGVGQGSSRPPRLLRLAYRHPDAQRHLALVGKGITFDSGGISLKPGANMHEMKSDMAGAAAVITATLAVARLGLPVNVTAFAAMAENLPSDTAQRPGDVLTTYGGRTVEVLNTDAEGRLVLADALVRAQEESPDAIIDVATLTGAALVALGPRTAGIMSNDADLTASIGRAAGATGESMWTMDLPAYLRKRLDSQVADIANIGDRNGGMLQAGLFLQEFIASGQAWAHLDIAGPAWNSGEPYGVNPKGGTGASVYTLVEVARSMSAAD